MQLKAIPTVSYVTLAILLILWPVGSGILQVLTAEDVKTSLANRTLELYLPTLAIQLLIVALVLGTLRLERRNLRSLYFDRPGFEKFFLGAAFFVGSAGILALITFALDSLGIAHFEDPSHLLPRTTTDKIVWIFLATTVAFAEEIAFRGFALTRLDEVTGSKVVSALVVSATFALGHIYQGSGGVIVIFIYALMFSALFYASKSIWPCMVAHFMQDMAPLLASELLQRTTAP